MTRWLLAALIDWIILGLVLYGSWRWPSPPVILLALIVLGNRQHAIGVLGHDGAHFNITHRRWLNDALTQLVVAWPLGLSLEGYRMFHCIRHHRAIALGDSLSDPETHHRDRFPRRHAYPVTVARKFMLFVGDLSGVTSVPEFLSLARYEIFPHTGRTDKIGLFVFWATVTSAAWTFHLLPLVGLWFTALLTSFWAFARLRMWREHFGVAGTNDIPVPWWGFLFHLPHNIGEHAEHHACAWRPFYQLGKEGFTK